MNPTKLRKAITPQPRPRKGLASVAEPGKCKRLKSFKSEVQILSLASLQMTDHPFLINLTIILSYAIPILIAVAFLTLVERKILSYIQGRKGPNIVGPFGLLQPVADGVKLFIKEPIRPSTSSPILFITTPILALLLAISI